MDKVAFDIGVADGMEKSAAGRATPLTVLKDAIKTRGFTSGRGIPKDDIKALLGVTAAGAGAGGVAGAGIGAVAGALSAPKGERKERAKKWARRGAVAGALTGGVATGGAFGRVSHRENN